MPIALYKLLFILPKFEDELQQALCHSTIASCYEKLNIIDKAREHIKKAIELRKKHLGDKHKLTLHAKLKLDKLQSKDPILLNVGYR